jgi:DNA-binding NarL/FixJ family response regulator
MAVDQADVNSQQLRSNAYRAAAGRVLVVHNWLLFADAVVLTLVQRGFAARPAVPPTLQHLQDVITWGPNVALLDVELLEADPIGFLKLFRESGVSVVVVGGNGHDDRRFTFADMAGVAVIESSMRLEHLVRTIGTLLPSRDCRESQRRSPPLLRTQGSMASRLGLFAVLTPHEQSLLAELMEGRTAEAIAQNGRVGVSTVYSLIKSILQKLGVNSQPAAVAFARQAGWTYRVAGMQPLGHLDGYVGSDRRVHEDPWPATPRPVRWRSEPQRAPVQPTASRALRPRVGSTS